MNPHPGCLWLWGGGLCTETDAGFTQPIVCILSHVCNAVVTNLANRPLSLIMTDFQFNLNGHGRQCWCITFDSTVMPLRHSHRALSDTSYRSYETNEFASTIMITSFKLWHLACTHNCESLKRSLVYIHILFLAFLVSFTTHFKWIGWVSFFNGNFHSPRQTRSVISFSFFLECAYGSFLISTVVFTKCSKIHLSLFKQLKMWLPSIQVSYGVRNSVFPGNFKLSQEHNPYNPHAQW